MIKLSLVYYYKGSSNCELHLTQEDEFVSLYTDYNELIASVRTVKELEIISEELESGKYA